VTAENKKRILILFVVLACCAAARAKVELGSDVLKQRGCGIHRQTWGLITKVFAMYERRICFIAEHGIANS
jgi:hypothetical protein